MHAASVPDLPCRVTISQSGLPQRSELLVKRDREAYAGYVAALASNGGKGELADAASPTTHALVAAYESRRAPLPMVVAFLVGRCRTGDATADAALTAWATEQLASERHALNRVEWAMSLVLRGRASVGRPVLEQQAHKTDPLEHGYLAAAYLAEMGDPSAFPTVVATLQASFNRGMAARWLIAWMPWDGQLVGGIRVDLRALLAARLHDEDPIIRREIPRYLVELGAPNLQPLLAPIAEHDPDEATRHAAATAIGRAH